MEGLNWFTCKIEFSAYPRKGGVEGQMPPPPPPPAPTERNPGALRKFCRVHTVVGKMAQDVGMVWKCCGVIPIGSILVCLLQFHLLLFCHFYFDLLLFVALLLNFDLPRLCMPLLKFWEYSWNIHWHILWCANTKIKVFAEAFSCFASVPWCISANTKRLWTLANT